MLQKDLVITKFYIASDDENLFNQARAMCKDRKVIYYNSHRSTNSAPVWQNPNFNRAILGEEVLIEALLLSKCDVFVHTNSNVATGVLILNPDLKNIFIN